MIAAALLFSTTPEVTRSFAPPHTASLSCGHADFTLTSLRWADGAAPLAPVSQTMSVRVDSGSRPVALEPFNKVVVDTYRVRDRYVFSWACMVGAQGHHYVTIGYACAIDRGYPGDCGGEREWFRLLDERGRAVDAGLPHDGPPVDRLERRLGLARQMRRGVQMIDVLD